MKILNIKKGFTTNSSGSYEWLPLVSSSTDSVSVREESQFTPAGQKSGQLGDWILLPITVIAGIIAVGIIVKEIIKTVKQGESKK